MKITMEQEDMATPYGRRVTVELSDGQPLHEVVEIMKGLLVTAGYPPCLVGDINDGCDVSAWDGVGGRPGPEIDTLAEAAFNVFWRDEDSWDKMSEETQEVWRNVARAVLERVGV